MQNRNHYVVRVEKCYDCLGDGHHIRFKIAWKCRKCNGIGKTFRLVPEGTDMGSYIPRCDTFTIDPRNFS